MSIDKILYFTDSHYGTQPVNRKDDYNESILNKIEQLLAFAEKNECVVVMGGDIFDSTKISFIHLIKLIKVFRKYKTKGVYSVVGNHDIKAGHSPLELIESVKIIQLPKYVVNLENTRIIFSHYEMLDKSKIDTMIDDMKYNILATHENITKEPFIGQHVLMSDYQTNADMVLVAHYHPEQGNVKRKDGKIFIAPGALARRKRVTHDMNRIPCAAYITVDEEQNVSLKTIRLKCDMDIWKEQSYFDSLDVSSDYRNEITVMKNIINRDCQVLSIEDAIFDFAKEMNVEKDIVEHCLGEIRNA